MTTMRARALAAAIMTMLAAIAPATATAAVAGAEVTVPAGLEEVCRAQASTFAVRSADPVDAQALVSGSVHVGSYDPTPLPDDIDWSRPPDTAANFQVEFQSLVWVDVLRREYVRTGEQTYLDRYTRVLEDFVADNPDYTHPLTVWSWYDHPQGQRASVLACAMTVLGQPDWLVRGVREHIRAISDPASYRGTGNHALMQNTGMVTAGLALGDSGALGLGRERAQRLLPVAISNDGVSLEGSVSYHALNHIWWREFEAVLQAAGGASLSGSERIQLMDRFGADATFPDGTAANIGDGFPGSGSRYDAADARAFAVYTPGYLFSRTTGAGGTTVLGARYGQAYSSMVHGHWDAGSLQVWAFGTLLLSDSGTYAYQGGFWRSWVTSPAAHNVVTAYGSRYVSSGSGRIVRWVRRNGYVAATFSLPIMEGVTWYRTIKQSLAHGWVLVDDQVRSATSRSWIQRWNVPDAVRYQVLTRRVDQTTGSGGRVSVIAVAGAPSVSLRAGVRAQTVERTVGWRSYSYARIEAAPTVEFRRTGTSWHVVTLIAPRKAGESPSTVQVSNVIVTASGAAVTVSTARGTARTAITRLR